MSFPKPSSRYKLNKNFHNSYIIICLHIQNENSNLKTNGTAHFKKYKQLFEYQHFLFLRDIWWSKI